MYDAQYLVSVEDVEQSGEGELVDAGNLDGEDPGGWVHALGEDVAGGEGDDPLLRERVGPVAGEGRWVIWMMDDVIGSH